MGTYSNNSHLSSQQYDKDICFGKIQLTYNVYSHLLPYDFIRENKCFVFWKSIIAFALFDIRSLHFTI